MRKTRRWVIKAGTQMVVGGGPLLLGSWMRQITQLRKTHHIDVVWVTSGAIGWASERTDFHRARRTLPEKQALSAIGQPLVIAQYLRALDEHGALGAQVLITADDMTDVKRRRNLKNTLDQLRAWKVIPILNENDAVATEEIKFGDNDSLAARVATVIRAERLILLTDVDGLYDADPKRFANARLITHLDRIGAREIKGAKGKSTLGTGGMYSKLLAAELALKSKVITHLSRGDVPDVILNLARGRTIGTQIGGPRV